MSILPQPRLFSWQEVEATREILRLQRLLDALPDAELLAALEAERAGKRNDYPLPALWRALLAAIVFGHGSLASLGRELARNGQLRDLCGFDPLRGDQAVPPAGVWTRFIATARVSRRATTNVRRWSASTAGSIRFTASSIISSAAKRRSGCGWAWRSW